MKHLIVIGIGGFPRELYDHSKGSIGFGTEWDFKGFLDGDKKAPDWEYERLPMPLLGDIFSYEIEEDDVFIVAVGAPHIKKRLVEIIEKRGGKFISVIHKSAIIQERAKIGQGVILTPGACVNSWVTVGDHVSSLGASIGHDTIIGDYCSLMGRVSICGRVKIGKLVYIGTGAVVLPDARIDDEAYVGANSLVLKRVKAGDKVFGVPAISIA